MQQRTGDIVSQAGNNDGFPCVSVCFYTEDGFEKGFSEGAFALLKVLLKGPLNVKDRACLRPQTAILNPRDHVWAICVIDLYAPGARCEGPGARPEQAPPAAWRTNTAPSPAGPACLQHTTP